MKHLTHHFLKHGVFFISGILVWASIFLLTQASYTVQTNIDNAVQVIKRIVLQQSDGITTGSILSGDTINTVHMQATQYCDEGGNNCKDVADLITGYVETDSVFLAHSGDYYTTGQSDTKYLTSYVESDPVFLTHSGDYYTTGESDSRYLGGWWTNLWNTWSNSSINYTLWKVGIWTTDPNTKLDVKGTLSIQETDFSSLTSQLQLIRTDVGWPTKLWSIAFIWEASNWTRRTWWRISYHDSNWFNFETRSGTLFTNKFTIYPNGNIGIGTPIPTSILDVNGDAHIRWELFVDQTVTVNNTTNVCSAFASIGETKAATWTIKFSWSNFYGCNGSARVQLNN